MKTQVQEEDLTRMILLVADIQNWLQDISTEIVNQLHPPAKRLLHTKQYRISISSLAHILERHYHKSLRHPDTGKFLIPVWEILDRLKEAAAVEPEPMPGSINFKRALECDSPIGIDRHGHTSWTIQVITDHSGLVLSAYPV